MTDTSAGFRVRGRMSGAPETVQDLLFKDTETLTKADMVNLETGEVDLAVTGDTTLYGVVKEIAISGIDSTTRIKITVDEDAIYGVFDPVARLAGATLDIVGATGAQTVAAPVNKEFVVHAESAADQETLVRFNVGKHVGNVAL